MRLSWFLGLCLLVVVVACAVVLTGGSLTDLVNAPALLLVFGGCAAACVMAFPAARLLHLHTFVARAMFGQAFDARQVIDELVRCATVAHHEGRLALANTRHQSGFSHPLITSGLHLLATGADANLLRSMLDTQAESASRSKRQASEVFKALARYAPAFGLIATLIGIMAMLENTDDPARIGAAVALSLVAAVYGFLLAAGVCGPVADRLHAQAAADTLAGAIIIDGLVAIQSGESPERVKDRLMAYIPPDQRPSAANPTRTNLSKAA